MSLAALPNRHIVRGAAPPAIAAGRFAAKSGMPSIAVIGAGPAGLFAAETLAAAGHSVTIYDRMPTPARKFQLAGRGGLNITHAEPLREFMRRYGEAECWLRPALEAFPPESLRAWCAALGEPSFVGSSGRVFPQSFKAAPLLRAWLGRLAAMGVTLASRHFWQGWGAGGALSFATPAGPVDVNADATVFCLGGASWPRLGADGGWAALFRARGVALAPFRPANCGALVAWSSHLRARFAGAPLKRIAASLGPHRATGEITITETGLEGGPVYALSAPLRAALDQSGQALLHLDLRPDLSASALAARLDGPSGGTSLSNQLRAAGLAPAAIALVNEARHAGAPATPLSQLVRAVPIPIHGQAPLTRAISSAGGITRAELDDNFMLKSLPGVFAAGEMLDWEAPTGGYLLQACFSTAHHAARGADAWLASRPAAASTVPAPDR